MYFNYFLEVPRKILLKFFLTIVPRNCIPVTSGHFPGNCIPLTLNRFKDIVLLLLFTDFQGVVFC